MDEARKIVWYSRKEGGVWKVHVEGEQADHFRKSVVPIDMVPEPPPLPEQPPDPEPEPEPPPVEEPPPDPEPEEPPHHEH